MIISNHISNSDALPKDYYGDVIDDSGQKIHVEYVQDGLVAMYDGRMNGLNGRHSLNKRLWRDCSGNGHDLMRYDNTKHVKIRHNCYEFLAPPSGFGCGYMSSSAIGREPKTIEIVYMPKRNLSMTIFNATYEQKYYFHVTQIKGTDDFGNIALGYTSRRRFLDLGTENRVFSISMCKKDNDQCAADGFVNNVDTTVTDTCSGWGYVYGGGQITIGNCTEDNFSGNNTPQANPLVANVYNIRVYDRRLTEQERTHNFLIDCKRFNII